MTVLFDLDGTILGRKEEGKLRNYIARKLQVPKISKEEYYEACREVIRDSKVDTRLPIFEKILNNEELANQLAKEYRKKALTYTFVYSDAEEVLQNLKVKKGLVTNGPRLVQREKIKRFGLKQYFQNITISGEIGKSKPGPEIFLSALENLGSTPEESLYVGDTPEMDINGASNAGLTSVLITRHADSPGPEPDYKIEDLRELYDIVKKS